MTAVGCNICGRPVPDAEPHVCSYAYVRLVTPLTRDDRLTPCGARACTGCRVCGCPALGIAPGDHQ